MSVTAAPNPFHPEAVATYGQVVRTCEDLGYMGPALEELNQYLIDYPEGAGRRYGAAIGVKGGHGSGKTHLLMWLAEKAKNRSKIQPVVLYAKADRASFADLYSQLLAGLPRERMQELINEALAKLAQEQVGRAKLTEDLAERTTTPEGIEALDKEAKIDLEHLVIQLQSRLDNPENPVPGVIPRTLTLVNNSRLGEKAYHWLAGQEIDGLADLNLTHQLFQPESAKNGGAENSLGDITAVNALETIAALLLTAERPLIVLIDQLEVLLRAEPARQQTLFSVIKKMIEQLKQQNALTFIAGNSESWDSLPPDVTPRLRRRKPFTVGNLSFRETRNLLEAYTDGLRAGFKERAVETIHALSGGNPREIIRIAYYAYNDAEVQGDLSRVDEAILMRSAGESMTVEERNRLALAAADAVLGELGGALRTNIQAENNVLIDRMLVYNNRPRLALMTMKATDKLSEISSARRVRIARNYLEQKYPSVPLICVPVGYLSDEVEGLIGQASTVLPFDEKSFVAQLRASATELLAQQGGEGGSDTDPSVIDFLKAITERLNTLETERSEELDKIAERFAEKARTEAEPERKAREINSRWDMVNALDRLQEALNAGQLVEEHKIMRSILVANEANVKARQIDFLGGIYLDLIAEARFTSPSPSTPVLEPEVAKLADELRESRTEIIRGLRRLLRGKRAIDYFVEQPWRYSLLSSLVACTILALAIVWIAREALQISWSYTGFSFPLWLVVNVLPACLFTAFFIVSLTFILRWVRLNRWERLVKRTRRKLHKDGGPGTPPVNAQ
jgi:hypothetical protein